MNICSNIDIVSYLLVDDIDILLRGNSLSKQALIYLIADIDLHILKQFY